MYCVDCCMNDMWWRHAVHVSAWTAGTVSCIIQAASPHSLSSEVRAVNNSLKKIDLAYIHILCIVRYEKHGILKLTRSYEVCFSLPSMFAWCWSDIIWQRWKISQFFGADHLERLSHYNFWWQVYCSNEPFKNVMNNNRLFQECAWKSVWLLCNFA